MIGSSMATAFAIPPLPALALAGALLGQAQPPPLQPIPLVQQPQPAPQLPRLPKLSDSQTGAPSGEPQVFVRPKAAQERPFLSRAADAVGSAVRRLWKQEEPHALAGNAKAAAGDVDGALADYDEAEKKLPAGDPQAALAFDRSSALLKGAQEAAPKALEQALRAGESSDPSLRAKAAYNAALALEQAGKPEEAIKAYGQALSLDPGDVDSKVNLELLLRTDEQKKQQSAGPQDPDAKKKPQDQKAKDQQKAQGEKKDEQEKKDQQEQQKKEEDEKKKQEEKEAQPKPQEQKDKEQKEQQQQADKDKPPEKQEAPQEQLGRSEAQRLLDAARAGEKNLQTWRFGKKADPRKRHAAEKDW